MKVTSRSWRRAQAQASHFLTWYLDLWATRNNSKVVVATYTITLQGQPFGQTYPFCEGRDLLTRPDKRPKQLRLSKASGDCSKNAESGENKALQSISQFIQTSKAGSCSDMEVSLMKKHGTPWARIMNKPSYQMPTLRRLFYYNARRKPQKPTS